MRILIIGGGGREHAITWSLKRSITATELFIAPGNGGTAVLGSNVDLHAGDHQSIVDFVVEEQIDMVIIGPEQPLVDGLADTLREHEIPVVGPSAAAARSFSRPAETSAPPAGPACPARPQWPGR